MLMGTITPIAIENVGAQVGAAVSAIGESIVLDKAGNEFRQSINHAHAAASSILGQANAIAKARLVQIDEIANRTIMDMIGKSEEAAMKILEDALEKVASLEQQILTDVKQIIGEGKCAAEPLLSSDSKKALEVLRDAFGTHQLHLTIPGKVLQKPAWYTGCFWWCQNPHTTTVTKAFEKTYRVIKNLIEDYNHSRHSS